MQQLSWLGFFSMILTLPLFFQSVLQLVLFKVRRDDIIVKVNLQSPIPTSFYTTVQTIVETMQGRGFVFLPSLLLLSSLLCLHTFWHAIPTSLFFLFNQATALLVQLGFVFPGDHYFSVFFESGHPV